MRAKPVDLHELDVLRSANAFNIYDCDTRSSEIIKDREVAWNIALTNPRKLVYGFRESDAMPHQVLLTKKLKEIELALS